MTLQWLQLATQWTREAISHLHLILRNILNYAHLPVNESKSCPPHVCETTSISFLGYQWDFKTSAIQLRKEKLTKVIIQAETLSKAQNISYGDFSHFLGRIVWACIINRPLLSSFNSVFRFQQQLQIDQIAGLPDTFRKEIHNVLPLLHNLHVSPTLPICQTIICFDASLYGWSRSLLTILRGTGEEYLVLRKSFSAELRRWPKPIQCPTRGNHYDRTEALVSCFSALKAVLIPH